MTITLSREQVERTLFESHYPQLDFTIATGPWGKASYVHSHVQALWDGWFDRSALAQQAEPAVPVATSAALQTIRGYVTAGMDTNLGWADRTIALGKARKLIDFSLEAAPTTPPAEPSPAPAATPAPVEPHEVHPDVASRYAEGWQDGMAEATQLMSEPDHLAELILNGMTYDHLYEKALYLMALNANQARTIAELQDATPTTTPQEARHLLPKGFISDVLTAAGLVTHGKQCKALGARLGNDCMSILAGKVAQEAPEGLTADDLWASEEVMAVNAECGLGMGLLLRLTRAIESATIAKVKPS